MNDKQIKTSLCKGWNTWNTWSVLSHVLLPDGLAVNLSFKEYASGAWLREALIGRQGAKEEKIVPGAHAYDGAYTELTLQWRSIKVHIESAHAPNDELVILITPLSIQQRASALLVEMGFLWNCAGSVCRTDEGMRATNSTRTVCLYASRWDADEINVPMLTPHLTIELREEVALSTGKKRSIDEVKQIIKQARTTLIQEQQMRWGEYADIYAAMQSCLAWDTIYEPQKKRVVTTVSRIWNVSWGGYVLFEWDTYFAARMIALENRALAYANVLEITRESRELGFVPNSSSATGVKSRDRSQPPVGSRMVLELYHTFGEKWILEALFEDLYRWNEWYFEHRHIGGGLMAWGSNPYEPQVGNEWEVNGVNDRFGGALESGLDNSPMYDDIPFDKEKHVLCLADAGLCGLYAMDCRALREIAHILGKSREEEALQMRLTAVSKGIQRLWDDENGFFYNLHTDTGKFSRRISPTCFYPLFAEGITEEQIRRVIQEHLLNEKEFFGEWMIPSISRSDAAYEQQRYWRGRIWAPLNYLVYLAFRDREQKEVCQMLADKSAALLLGEWRRKGWVCENYDADTGRGEVRGMGYGGSDRFYSWGGLLGLMALMEKGLTSFEK